MIFFPAKIVGIWRSFCFKMAARCRQFFISLLLSTKQYNKKRRYHLSTFQVSCNYLVYFLRSNKLYTCIIIFYLQDVNIFDGATKITTTKLSQLPFSYSYKTIFPRLKMFIVHNPILSNLSYLSEQISVWSNMEK